MEFLIIPKQVHMEGDLITIIKEWPMPKYHRDIQVFLEFNNFYRRFIKGFSKIVRPMTAMLKGGKEGKIFSPLKPMLEMKEAFRRLQSKFIKALVLVHVNYKRPIRQETDASRSVIAGIISQLLASLTATGKEVGRLKNCG